MVYHNAFAESLLHRLHARCWITKAEKTGSVLKVHERVEQTENASIMEDWRAKYSSRAPCFGEVGRDKGKPWNMKIPAYSKIYSSFCAN